MANLSSLVAAWDRYTTEHRDEQFTWAAIAPATDESPGVEVMELRPGYRVLDLGCGAADNAAHLAALGVQVTGIDLSPVQVATAQERWGQVTNLTVEQGEAVEYLSATSDAFDAVYSVFGAVWFTDPEALLSGPTRGVAALLALSGAGRAALRRVGHVTAEEHDLAASGGTEAAPTYGASACCSATVAGCRQRKGCR